MKKIILSVCFIAAVAVGNVFAQEAETKVEPTKLGNWTRPGDTKIAEVEKYLDACAALYKEAMDIRKQYETIDTAVVNLETISEEAGGESDAMQQKRDEYKAVMERIQNQDEPASKIPDLASDAVSKIPKSLKAVSVTKAINSGKDAVKLAIEENAALLKAATAQMTSLSAAPKK